MSCGQCVHWHREHGEDDPDNWALRPGLCYRYPQSLEVSADHHCGEWVASWLSSQLGEYARSGSARQDARKYKARALAAEKALKATRGEVRELKRQLKLQRNVTE